MTDSAHVVFVVDDDAAMREALSSLIRSVGFDVVVFASAADFLIFERPNATSCLILDVRLPGQSGLELQRELRSAGECPPIIFITGHGDIPMSVRAMKAGAIEFLPKPFREQDLLDAIAVALERDVQTKDRREAISRIQGKLRTLTPREREVMAGLLEGQLNKQVAASLGVSEVTVKLHRRRVMRKMSVTSLVKLAQMMARVR